MEINIAIPVYNEGKTIPKTMNYLIRKLSESDLEPKFFFCLNGCTDDSEQVVKSLDCDKEVLESEPGKIKAHKRIVDRIKESRNEYYTVFMDADTYADDIVIKKLISELDKRSKLRIVSAYPVSIRPKKTSLIQKFWYEIINIKRHYPKVEIARYDVSHIHDEDDPWKRQSRIYIHGRLFAMKDVNDYFFPKDDTRVVGDDTILSRKIIHRYGKGSLKVLFDANVRSQGLCSAREYIKYWHRILADVEIIAEEYPDIKYLNKLSETKMNWNYILFQSKDFNVIWKSIGFSLLKSFVIMTFKFKKNKLDATTEWKYDDKEVEVIDDED